MGKTRKKSSLTNMERLSPNCNKPRLNRIRGSTPHHMAGNLSIETCMNMTRVLMYDPNNGMSMNYAIGSDGRIGLCVEESNRAWTSSSPINDHRCITTEIANNGGAPDWRISDSAINAWLDLTVEQCRFYGFKKVNYQEKPANVKYDIINGRIVLDKIEAWIATWAKDDEWIITLHNWFNATACPGPYLTRQLPWLVKEMNKRLSNNKYVPEAFVGEGNGPIIQVVKPQESLKSIDEIAQEVIVGKWGNGQDRIDRLTKAGYNALEVQVKVDLMLKKTDPVAFQEYHVTIDASALNVRKGPGMEYPIVTTLINDKNVYTIIEEANGIGTTKWGHLKSKIGWISLDFTKRK